MNKNPFKNIRRILSTVFYRSYTLLYSLTHKIEKKILFTSFGGKQYSDNPRAISEKMHELYPDFKIVWILNRPDEYNIVPKYITIIQRNKKHKFEFYRELATCFCYITNFPIGNAIRKRKNQLFIQTGHGDRGPKKILIDAGVKGFSVNDNKVVDYFTTGSEFGERRASSAYLYKGQFLKKGMPRNDKLINYTNEECNLVKQRLGVESEKILLYAPTFRDGAQGKQETLINIDEVMAALEKKTGFSWVCIIRAHVASKGLAFDSTRKIINATNYFDMADLLMIADAMITDYSSSAGDYILTDRPLILAAFDREEYERNCHKFYFNLSDAGYIIAGSQKELINIINTYDESDYRESCKKVKEFFKEYETGKASEYVCHLINEKYVQTNN